MKREKEKKQKHDTCETKIEQYFITNKEQKQKKVVTRKYTPFGIGVTKMTNIPVKVSFQLHIKQLMNLDDIKYVFFKTPFVSFFYVQHNSIKKNMPWN
jgi:hypothetical protein